MYAAAELLIQFNLTRQEAIIYLTLISEGSMNGYEAAKTTGLSRSNAYTSLASLVEKGCAYIIEGSTVQYTPVPIEEFCTNRIRSLQETMKELQNTVPARKEEAEGYITVKGEDHILNKMRNMISEAKERLYVSASGKVLDEISPELKAAITKGIKVVLIANVSAKLEGAVIYHADSARQQLRLIVDSSNVLTGDIDEGKHSTCLYSKNKNLVDLLKDSLKNEIKIIEITKGSVL